MYSYKPCHKEKLGYRHHPVSAFNKSYIKNMFQELSKNCPCMDCIIKVVCLPKRLDCDMYLALLASVDKSGWRKEIKEGDT
jgi:hypothetical protein